MTNQALPHSCSSAVPEHIHSTSNEDLLGYLDILSALDSSSAPASQTSLSLNSGMRNRDLTAILDEALKIINDGLDDNAYRHFADVKHTVIPEAKQ